MGRMGRGGPEVEVVEWSRSGPGEQSGEVRVRLMVSLGESKGVQDVDSRGQGEASTVTSGSPTVDFHGCNNFNKMM